MKLLKRIIFYTLSGLFVAAAVYGVQQAIVSTDTLNQAWTKETANNSDLQVNINGKQTILAEGAFVDGDKTNLDNQSGTNTGDEPAADLTTQGIVELATGAETVTGTDATRAVTPDGLTDKMAAPGAIGGTTPATSLATDSVTITASTTPGWTFNNSTAGNSTAFIKAQSTGAYDIIFSLYTDIAGTMTEMMQLDGVSETIDFLKPVTLTDDISIRIEGSADGMADDKYNGITVSGIDAGAGITQWNLVYLDNDTDPIKPADGDLAGSFPAFGIAVASATDTNPVIVLTQGVVRNEGWTGLTIGGEVYLSDTTGEITQTALATSGDCIQIVGFAISDSEVYFDFSRPYQEVE